MDRIIKFRGKRYDNNEWVYGIVTRHKIGSLICPCILVEHEWDNGDFIEYIEVKGETLGQYIGLKAKVNQKEIYEGDVIKALHRNYDNVDDRDKFFETFKVTYLKGCYMFGNWNAHEFFNRFIYTEVIGNEFETPELWKRSL